MTAAGRPGGTQAIAAPSVVWSIPAMATAGTSPLRDPHFRRLYAAQVFSLVAFGVATVGLALLAYDLVGGNAGVVLGAAFGLKMAAKLVVAPIAGAYGTRVPRKVLLAGVEVVRVGLLFTLPFVDAVWQLYALILVMSACEAVFNPAYEAILPDLFTDTARYTKALSLSRIAINGETLASPLLAAAALLYLDFDGLFVIAAVASVAATVFILAATIPAVAGPAEQERRFVAQISFGVRRYFREPELRSVLIVYLAIALASAMLIVNTVVYVRETLGLADEAVARVLLFQGLGAIAAIVFIPRLVARFGDKPVMLAGGLALGPLLALGAVMPGFWGLAGLWAAIGAALGIAMTPAGLVITRTIASGERPALFAAQYALTHGCWLIAYPFVGWIVAAAGFPTGFLVSGVLALGFALYAAAVWPQVQPAAAD